MLSQASRSSKRLLASSAMVRLYASVDTLVILQAPEGPEGFATPGLLTIVRVLSSMNSHVGFQICPLVMNCADVKGNV